MTVAMETTSEQGSFDYLMRLKLFLNGSEFIRSTINFSCSLIVYRTARTFDHGWFDVRVRIRSLKPKTLVGLDF